MLKDRLKGMSQASFVEYGYGGKKEDVKWWYDGFIFGKQKDMFYGMVRGWFNKANNKALIYDWVYVWQNILKTNNHYREASIFGVGAFFNYNIAQVVSHFKYFYVMDLRTK